MIHAGFRWFDDARAWAAVRWRAHTPEPTPIAPEVPPVPTPAEFPPITDPPAEQPPTPVDDPPDGPAPPVH